MWHLYEVPLSSTCTILKDSVTQQKLVNQIDQIMSHLHTDNKVVYYFICLKLHFDNSF